MRTYKSLYFIVFILFIIVFSECKNAKETEDTFMGDSQSVLLADNMFEAIGGKEAWCNLRSLYIKAKHNEPQMTIPYQSEIWRAIDTFQLVIEQQNDSFHVKGVFSQDFGSIYYLDERDTSRTLNESQLKSWEFDHKHNIYVLLHDLACNPAGYRVEIDEKEQLSFFQDSVLLTSFGLDDQNRPHLFYKPNQDGTVSGSIFTHWGSDGGLVHSAGGHPLDSNFIYRTEIWFPSNKTIYEEFGNELFTIDDD